MTNSRYLECHPAVTGEQDHRTTERLAAWVRNGLSPREKARVDTHLTVCAVCRDFAAELAEINSAL
jgi:anti-sigma factor RsiW